jgi:retron-type reverse transcriptase
MQLTIRDCFSTRSLESSALHLLNQLLHSKSKAFANNGGDYWEFGSNLSTNLSRIDRLIRTGRYCFSPYIKRTRIMKNGKSRDLYRPTWADKVVERWLAESLNKLLHNWMSPNSYAYRSRDFCIDVCQWRVLSRIGPDSLIVKRDISNCFYSINHGFLLKQLEEVINPDDALMRMLKERVQFDYFVADGQVARATVGVPFGSSIACTLANVALTCIDRRLDKLPVHYFRYADDFLIVGTDQYAVMGAANVLDTSFADLTLQSKPSHRQNLSFCEHEGFDKIHAFKYLGLDFTADQLVRLGVEKQRKVIRLIRRDLDRLPFKRVRDRNERLGLAINAVNRVLTDKIRSVAIIDYYLRHVTDEQQLKQLDLLIAQLVISRVLDKPFRYKDFSTIRFKRLRELGLISLLYRCRLFAHGHLKTNFLQMRNSLVSERFWYMHETRQKRVEHAKLSRKQRRAKAIPG